MTYKKWNTPYNSLREAKMMMQEEQAELTQAYCKCERDILNSLITPKRINLDHLVEEIVDLEIVRTRSRNYANVTVDIDSRLSQAICYATDFLTPHIFDKVYQMWFEFKTTRLELRLNVIEIE